MLKELYIENLAVIERASVSLGPGMNVFTGETGAGKSILIGGINAVLGQRVSRDIVRAGAEKAFISAVFDGVTAAVSEKLQEFGVEPEDELIVSREISSDGRGTARINSRAVSVSALREIGGLLINIHGQHDSQVLLDPAKHLGILDSYAECEGAVADYRQSFRKLQAVARDISKLKQSEREKAQRITYLKSLVDDISSVKPERGEDDAVEEKFRLLENAAALSESLRNAVNILTGDDESGGVSAETASAYGEIESGAELMPALKPLCERLSSVGIEIGDISDELSRLLDSLDFDEGEYSRLSERRDALTRLKRRYGPTLDDAIDLWESSSEELEALSGSENELKRLSGEKDALLAEVSKKAEGLSKLRHTAAEKFQSEVEGELKFLNMPDVRIEVSFERGKLTQSGMDTVEFLISANRGEEPKPMAKIASGGELSRIMLALKSVLSDRDDIPTLIFDEIDTGVSGRAAQKIGIKLREISRRRQVICVTHLAQLAIYADEHVLIEKTGGAERTATEIKPLDFEGRKYEIARILGGDNITETVLKDAEEQLLSVRKEQV